MFTLVQLMRLGYVAGLAAVVVVLSAPHASRAQRAPIAPFLGTVNGLSQPSFQQAQSMIQLGIDASFGSTGIFRAGGGQHREVLH